MLPFLRNCIETIRRRTSVTSVLLSFFFFFRVFIWADRRRGNSEKVGRCKYQKELVLKA